MKKRIDEAWMRALETQQAATDDATHARCGDILAGLEAAISALALLD